MISFYFCLRLPCCAPFTPRSNLTTSATGGGRASKAEGDCVREWHLHGLYVIPRGQRPAFFRWPFWRGASPFSFWGFLKEGYLQIIHFNRILNYIPSILDIFKWVPHLWTPPCGNDWAGPHTGPILGLGLTGGTPWLRRIQGPPCCRKRQSKMAARWAHWGQKAPKYLAWMKKNHRKMVGFNGISWGLMGFYGIYPSVMTNSSELENHCC